MERVARPMHRYGEPDFDADYLRWGFHDPRAQLDEAESWMALARGDGSRCILANTVSGSGGTITT